MTVTQTTDDNYYHLYVVYKQNKTICNILNIQYYICNYEMQSTKIAQCTLHVLGNKLEVSCFTTALGVMTRQNHEPI